MGRLRFSPHALGRASERSVRREWVERVLAEPLVTEPDPAVSGRMLAFGRVAEFGGRVLRVVYEQQDEGILVVTVFWDRNAGRRM